MKDKICIRCSATFIPRNKNCDICTICKVPNKCIHGTTKGRCKIDGCFGNEICEHKQHKQKCTICKPRVHELDKLNSIIRKLVIKLATKKDLTKIQDKTKQFITGLFQVLEFSYVVEICQKKLQIYETHYQQKLDVHYFQIDHIKPKSKFNLSEPEQFAQCCHHTNLQIVDKRSNLKKNNKWNDKDEIFWASNIIYNEYNKIY